MTMYGYEIRNVYGLGAAELYKTAHQDDPDDILEGVAAAGLVGFLRQLGDLAEFAAEIFHGLHEEITNTASRSQNIMHRVQQLEADIPMVEKDLIHNTNTDYALIEGISWHPNLDTDSNIITKEEMPYSVMEFYKQSRGPPQLFRLDKFDMAGAGACLKRHTNPSFYRGDLSTYGIREGYRQETRTLKATRELNPISTDIARSLKMSQIASRQEVGTQDQGLNEVPIRRVILKQKKFNGSLLGQMQNLLETDSPAQYTSTELEKPNKSFTSVEKTSTKALHKRLTSLGSLINHNQNSQDTSSSDEKDDPPSSELLSNSSTTQQYQTGSRPDQDSESGESSDEYISDATASEVEFLDALTTAIVDSEMEMDSVTKENNNPSMVRVESKKFSSERKEEINNSTLLRSKSAFVTEDGNETEVAGTEAASAPISDGDVGKTMHETEPHYRTVSFNKVASKKVSYEENEPNLVMRNENGPKPTNPKLRKDSFSHSLRHMAKQLLDLKHDLTEDEEADSQDVEDNEDELSFDGAGATDSGIIQKGECLTENMQTGNATADQADITSQENELHGLQNIESIASEQLNTSKDFGEHEIHIRSDVRKDGEKREEISIDGVATNNPTMDRISNYEMPETENLHSIKLENPSSGEILDADETSAEDNAEETDETLMDGMVADSSVRELHQSEIAETQNLTLVDKEQELIESETYLGSYGMQHGEESYQIPGHGTVTKRSIKEEVLYNDTPDNENLSSEEGEELCESEMHIGTQQIEMNKSENFIDEDVFDGAVSETENLDSNEKELYESEMNVGSYGMQHGDESYQIPGHGTVTKRSIKEEVFYSDTQDNENLSLEEGEELCENEMHIGPQQIEMNKSANIIDEEIFDVAVSETEKLDSNAKELYGSEMYVGSYGMQHGEESYLIPGHGTVTKRSIKEEVLYNDTPDNENLSSEEGEELCENEMHIGPQQIEMNKSANIIDEEIFYGAVSETENLDSNEKELYESEMYVGLEGKAAEIYELPADGRENGDLIMGHDFDSGVEEFQTVNSIKNEEEFLENEKNISSDDMQHVMECYEMPTVSTVDENLVTVDGKQEILLQEQNAYNGDAAQIPASEYSSDEERTLSDNSDEERTLSDNSDEPWDSQVDDGISVEALSDQHEIVEEKIQGTQIQLVSPWPLINDNILQEALQNNNEHLEEEENENEEDDGGDLVVPQKAIEHEEVDPITKLGSEIEDEAVIPVPSDSEIVSVPRAIAEWETKIIDEAEISLAYNREIIPDRVIMSALIQSIVPTYEAAPEEGDIAPPLPPLPPMQWRTGKPQMDSLPGLGPMAPPPHSSNFLPLPNFSKLGRPPRPKSSGVAARERQSHEVVSEQNIENCEMISDTKEVQKCIMSPNLEKETAVNGFASVKRNPVSDDKILRYAEALVTELSVKEEAFKTGDDKFEREMREDDEPRKKLPSIPIPPKYPLFQVKSHDNSMMKKAPMLIQPASRLITPSMLEEIRNKSCSLKPVMVKKPNFMAPYSRTNLKVAAMLEKANAIRQAVGSDDSDDDSWSE